MPMLSVMKSLLSLSVIVPSCPKKSKPSVAAVEDIPAGHSPSRTRRRTLRPSSEGGRGGRTCCLGRIYHNEVWIIDLELDGTLVVQLTANSTSLFLRADIVGKRILLVLLEAGTRSAQVQRVPFQCLIYLNGFHTIEHQKLLAMRIHLPLEPHHFVPQPSAGPSSSPLVSIGGDLVLIELQGELSWEGDKHNGVVGVLGFDRPVSHYSCNIYHLSKLMPLPSVVGQAHPSPRTASPSAWQDINPAKALRGDSPGCRCTRCHWHHFGRRSV